jgi:mono/diheme cytochrome c family protein
MRTRKQDHDLVFSWLGPVVLAGMLAACGGGGDGGAGGSETATGGAGAGAPPPAADTAPAANPAPANPAPANPAPAPAADTAAAAAQGQAQDTGAKAAGGGGGGDAKLIALGDSIFHGQVGGGTCYVCHGQDGKGSAVGANLTDGEWLHDDGTIAGITGTITNGVPKPTKAPAPMPPMGGASLTPDQVKAVATYVHSLGGGK